MGQIDPLEHLGLISEINIFYNKNNKFTNLHETGNNLKFFKELFSYIL